MKYFILLITVFTFSTISYAQDDPIEGTEGKMELEKEIDEKSGKQIRIGTLILKPKPPLYIIDGNTIAENIVLDLDVNYVTEINVFKGEEATALYGKEGANGVVVIKLEEQYGERVKEKIDTRKRLIKETEESIEIEEEIGDKSEKVVRPMAVDPVSVNTSNDTLWIIEGYPVTKNDLNVLDPDHIAEINVFKGKEATAIYGSSGANGVIVVKLKKRYRKKFKKKMEAKG